MEGPTPPSAGAIIQYWDREPIPDDVERLVATFRDRNPDMRHMLFDERSAADFIAERFTPREVSAFRACAVPSVQSDYLRYCAVLSLGGIYVDVDKRCVAPLAPLLHTTEGATLFGWEKLPSAFRMPPYEWRERRGPYRAIPSDIFAFSSPGHPLLELALEITTTNIERRILEDAALATGPGVFTALYLMRESGSLESFVDYAKGGALEPVAPLIRDLVGDYATIERAFDDVRIPSMSEASQWVAPPENRLSYKATDDHWLNAKISIYR